jgi:hypothetical protein
MQRKAAQIKALGSPLETRMQATAMNGGRPSRPLGKSPRFASSSAFIRGIPASYVRYFIDAPPRAYFHSYSDLPFR